MNDFSPENIQKFIDQATKANGEAWQSQLTYFDQMVKRNASCLKDLGEARMASLKEMSEATTFNQAFEANLAFEEKMREELGELQDANIKAWEGMLEELKAIYLPAQAEPAKPSQGKKAA